LRFSDIRRGFNTYLRLERGLSSNTLEAYMHDVDLLFRFLEESADLHALNEVRLAHLQDFVKFIAEMELGTTSQARVISGIKAFFQYLILEKLVDNNPTELLEAPQLGQKLPEFLTIHRPKTEKETRPSSKRYTGVVCGFQNSSIYGFPNFTFVKV